MLKSKNSENKIGVFLFLLRKAKRNIFSSKSKLFSFQYAASCTYTLLSAYPICIISCVNFALATKSPRAHLRILSAWNPHVSAFFTSS